MTTLDCPNDLMQQLADWSEQGALRGLDYALTRFVHQQLPDSHAALLLACALVSERNAHGHVCLDLQQALQHPGLLLGTPRGNQADEPHPAREALTTLLQSLSLNQWTEILRASPAVTCLLDTHEIPADNGSSPLVLAGSAERPLLYLRRYWQYEQQIRQAIRQRLNHSQQLPLQATHALLDSLFPPTERPPTGTDWQKVACLLAARSSFAIITGGPGTGKTTTVVRLLALLQGLRLLGKQPVLNIHLAAPTGKAAARLSESIGGSIQKLRLPADLEEPLIGSIPDSVTTLHRLLGSLPDSRHFRHHAANPLPTDLVVVDEASMMDVEMMARLVDALPANARLILLGDKDQLASVEAGSVLGDLCQSAEAGHYTHDTLAWLAEYTGEQLDAKYLDAKGNPLQQATAMLRHSYRFSAHPGIGALATLANNGQSTPAELQQVASQHGDSLALLRLPHDLNDLSALDALAVAGFRGYLQTLHANPPTSTDSETLKEWAKNVFKAHAEFQLLTAVRQGTFGIDNLNQRVTAALRRAGLLPTSNTQWYHGRPLLVTRNDYSLKLMNGDIGICMQWPDGSLRVAFPDAAQGIRWVLPSRLQDVETVFAMTVHKSQGSEFTHTALILPERSNPVLTKELVYTGITRSKQRFTLVYSHDSVLQQALTSHIQRASGISPDV